MITTNWTAPGTGATLEEILDATEAPIGSLVYRTLVGLATTLGYSHRTRLELRGAGRIPNGSHDAQRVYAAIVDFKGR
jgi:hypothetical protein